jgi:FkbM family methyltransferase
MSLLSHPIAIKLRNVTRILGLNPLLASMFSNGKYEDAFDQALLNKIQSGDTIWDIGANIGYYSQKFAKIAGPDGYVYAFEPSPINFANLQKNTGQHANIRLLQTAVGDQEGTAMFSQGEDQLGATSSISQTADDNSIPVPLSSGDKILENKQALPPNVIKIDVEGYEYEVIMGMATVLQHKNLRCVGVEVHFGVLHQRGLDHAPKSITQLLAKAGFKVLWPDSSHILASR